MRQLFIQVPRGCGEQVLSLAQKHQGENLSTLQARGPDGDQDLVLVHVNNGAVGPFLSDVQAIDGACATLLPVGALPLNLTPGQIPGPVRHVQARSPIEVFLAGVQSSGSWIGLLGYAATAGIVVWIGLFTNTVYLLVAAMLLAPFAGPAMLTALATARGDGRLLWHSLLRYVAALAVAIAVAAGLSWAWGQQVATDLMVATSEVSAASLLLPLTAGAAGALNLVQSGRNSLVSGAAVGMLIAASLAPPAGVVGMGALVGDWGMVGDSLFVLGLQLVGINLAAAIVFRIAGLSPQGRLYRRGRAWVFYASLAVTVLALGGLLWLQFRSSPNLERTTRAERALATIRQTVNASGLAYLVQANTQFTRANIPGQTTLLATVYVQPAPQTSLAPAAIRAQLTQRLQQQILAQGFAVTPLIDVTVLQPPSGGGGGP